VDVHVVVITGAQAFFVDELVIRRQWLVVVVRVIVMSCPMCGRPIIEVQVQIATQRWLGTVTWGRFQLQRFLFQQHRSGLHGVQRLMAIVGRVAEQLVAMVIGSGLVTPRLQCIGRCGGAWFVRLAAAFEAGQFLVQVEFVQGLCRGCPVLWLDGCRLTDRWLRRGDGHHLRNRRHHRRVAGAVLLQQLLRRIEHLQAVAAAHHATRHAQLVVGDAKAGLAMRALSDETVGHAAIRELCREIF